jgi:RHS repeat-associated protein
VLNLRFRGQYADAESGLSYNSYRDYEPATGRYSESDPIGLHGGTGTYSYVESRPASWVDPEGLMADIPYPMANCGGSPGRTYCDGNGGILPKNCDKKCTKGCTQAHEDAHKQFSESHYGAGVCKGRQAGTSPYPVAFLSDQQLASDAAKSECAAMSAEHQCLKKLGGSDAVNCPECKKAFDKAKKDNDDNLKYYQCSQRM